MSARDVIAAAMSEDELQSRITSGTRREPGLCVQLGLMFFHAYDSRRSPHGWPDLVIARPHTAGYPGGAVLFVELKAAERQGHAAAGGVAGSTPVRRVRDPVLASVRLAVRGNRAAPRSAGRDAVPL